MNRQFSIKKGLFFIAGMQFFLALAFLLYSVFMSAYQNYNNTSNGYYQIGEQMLTNTETVISSLDQATLFPAQLYAQNNDSYICHTLRDRNVLKNFKFYSYFDNHAKTKLSNTAIDFIAVYDLDGNGVASSQNTAYRLSFITDEPGWMSELSSYKTGTPLLIPASHFYGSGMYDKDYQSVCIARGILDINSIGIVGYCIAGASTAYLEQTFHQLRLSPNQEFSIYKDQIPLFGTIDPSFNYDSFITDENSHSNHRHIQMKDHRLYVYNCISHTNGYSLIIQTPLSDITGSLFQFRFLYTLIICIILLAITGMIIYIVRKILSALNRLIETCNHFELDHVITVSFNDLPGELQLLFASFNRMSERISTLVQEVYLKQQKQQETELQLLRTQINPHYLYNTLEIMHMKAYSHGDYDVSSMAELLGQNLQYGLRNTTREVPLREELRQLNIYLAILNYQYKGRIQTNICIDANLMNCRIIKLVFQPIIENAVIHGIISSDQMLSIDILGYRDEDTLTIQISDDGQGMHPQQLNELKQNIENTTSSSIGLRNVCRRIQLYYGSEYTTEINSQYGLGTTVTLHFPWQTIEQSED